MIPDIVGLTNVGIVSISGINNNDRIPGYIDVYLNYEDLRSEYGYNYIPLSINGSFSEANFGGYGWNNYENESFPYTNTWYSGQTFDYNRNGYPVFNHAAELGDINTVHPVLLSAVITDQAWMNASSGRYSTTLTFTSQISYTADNQQP